MLEAAAGGNGPPAQSLAVNPFKTMLQGGSASGLLPSVRILGTLSLLPTASFNFSPYSSSPGCPPVQDFLQCPVRPLPSTAIHLRRLDPPARLQIPSLHWVLVDSVAGRCLMSMDLQGALLPHPYLQQRGACLALCIQLLRVRSSRGVFSMMENPQMQQMMQNVMSNPAMMEMALNSNPQMRAMVDANPQMRQMLQNPQLLQVQHLFCNYFFEPRSNNTHPNSPIAVHDESANTTSRRPTGFSPSVSVLFLFQQPARWQA